MKIRWAVPLLSPQSHREHMELEQMAEIDNISAISNQILQAMENHDVSESLPNHQRMLVK
jgi:hypothetical protein